MNLFQNIQDKFKVYIRSLKDLAKAILPSGREEYLVLAVSMVACASLGLYILYTSSAIDSKVWTVDAYWGFDNSAIFLRGYTNIPRHPLLTIFTKPLIVFSEFIASHIGYKAKGICFVLVCNLCVSLALVYIFRYLRDIVELGKKTNYIFLVFTLLCPSILLLSFTSDTFTFSLPILCFVVYYYSLMIKQNKNMSLVNQALLTIASGGITITNAAKSIIPVFFTKGGIKKHIKETVLVGLAFLAMLLLIEYKHGVFEHIIVQSVAESPTVVSQGSYLKNAVDYFFVVPILLSEITNLHSQLGLEASSTTSNMIKIVPSFYNSYYYYIPLALFYMLIIYSIFKNWNNKYLIMLCLIWLCDIVIHLFAKFGIEEAYLYAGHWIYILSMMLAWGVQKLDKNKRKVYLSICGLIAFIILINNMIKFADFIRTLQDYYPPIVQ